MANWKYNFVPDDEMTFFYQGHFCDSYLKEILRFVGQTKEILENPFSEGKVAFLIAESYQNIIRHGITDYDDQGISTDLFCLRNIPPFMHIFSSNEVEAQSAEELKNRLESIKRLSKPELKEKYLDILATGEVSEKGGAGLGLVAMARKSYKSMQHKFTPNKGGSEYDLQVDVLLDKSRKSEEIEYLQIDQNATLIEKLKKDNVIFFYCGEINTETIAPLLYLMRKNAEFTFINPSRLNKLYHIGLEMLQNSTLNGKKGDAPIKGTFTVSVANNSYILCTESRLTREKCLRLGNTIEKINKKSKDELNISYKEALIKSARENIDSTKVILIEILRLCNKPLTYDHKMMDGTGDYFKLTASFN